MNQTERNVGMQGGIINNKKLEIAIFNLLKELGVPSHIIGYSYLKSAIGYAFYDMDYIYNMTKKLYPAIAKEHQTTSSKVERAMRHAIEIASSRGNFDAFKKVFSYSFSASRGKPTNSEFIAGVADYLRLYVDIED